LIGKPLRIYISENIWKQSKKDVKDGIIKKINTAKQILTIDKEISAGIYICALEEFGKLLLLRDCKIVNDKYVIKYRNEFVNHQVKLWKAYDYLQHNNSHECIVLDEVDNYSTSSSYAWKKFLAITEGVLGIFYSDFSISKKNNYKYEIMKIPKIDKNNLKDAINEFENVIVNFET
jgi:hypothetical protein